MLSTVLQVVSMSRDVVDGCSQWPNLCTAQAQCRPQRSTHRIKLRPNDDPGGGDAVGSTTQPQACHKAVVSGTRTQAPLVEGCPHPLIDIELDIPLDQTDDEASRPTLCCLPNVAGSIWGVPSLSPCEGGCRRQGHIETTRRTLDRPFDRRCSGRW